MRHLRHPGNEGEDLRLKSSPFARRIGVRVVDLNDDSLRGAEVSWALDGKPAGTAIVQDSVSFEVDDAAALVSVKATYGGVTQGPVLLAADQRSYQFQFEVVTHPLWRQFFMRHFPALIGILFILIAVTLSFVFADPSPLQKHVVLAMFALGGGGFGGEIAGFLKTDLTLGKKLVISAGGAAAIFVLLFFFVPAGASQ